MELFTKHWSGPKTLDELRVPFPKDVADRVLAEIDRGEHDSILNTIDPNEVAIHVTLKGVISAEHNK